MSPVRPKLPLIRLGVKQYRIICNKVLERDHWRCQICGSMRGLQIHHKEFRSHMGSDSEENLITLCDACHRRIHRRH
jgi:5-methylcytosine-specific restriction endonuclease McrA